MSDSRAIGVFDSGLGGLTVVKEIIKLLPDENIEYFGDTGRVPYGIRSNDTIKKYAFEDEKFLLSKDVKLIVAACGTVSSVAGKEGEQLPVPFIEVVSHSVNAAVNATKNKKIGVLATAATVKSHAHKNKILEKIPDAKVYEVAGTMLVHLVEEGWINKDDTVTYETVKRYLSPLKENGIDTLILGCTHFPILEDIIRDVLGDKVALINMGTAAAQAIKEKLIGLDMLNNSGQNGKHNFYVSDKTQNFKTVATTLLGEEKVEASLQLVNINEL